jgi:hypothetical protein
LPHVAPGARLSVGIAGQRFSGQVGVGGLLPTKKWIDEPSGTAGGSFRLEEARVDGCSRVVRSRETSLDGCVVFEAGRLIASGIGLDEPKRRHLTWLAPGGRLVGSVPLGRAPLRGLLGIEALVPLLSTDFTLERGSTKLYRPWPVVGRVDLGVAWRFK